jgi:hypothetical protein
MIGFGLGTSSVSTEVVLGNRYGSVGTTEIENRIFGFFFCLSRAGSGGSGFYTRLNLLGVTPEETQTSLGLPIMDVRIIVWKKQT